MKRISVRLAGRLRRSPDGLAAHSFHDRGRKEDQRGCYGAQAHRFERNACFGPDICPWKWWRRIETERFRHMVPPENLKVDCVPAEYPDDPADSAQPSHRQISGRCRCCMNLVYLGCCLATCLPAVEDDSADCRLMVRDAYRFRHLAAASGVRWLIAITGERFSRCPCRLQSASRRCCPGWHWSTGTPDGRQQRSAPPAQGPEPAAGLRRAPRRA